MLVRWSLSRWRGEGNSLLLLLQVTESAAEITAWIVGDYNDTAKAYNPQTYKYIQLTGSTVPNSRSIWPLATIDTGGAHIVSTRALANAFWGAFGIGPSADGMCKLEFQAVLI